MPKDASLDSRTAALYRMVLPDHNCPFGQKTLWFLKRQGLDVDDHQLTTRAETDAFMQREGVETTPQTYIDGQRIGGYEAVRTHFGRSVTRWPYRPVATLFGVAAAMATALLFVAADPGAWLWLRLFVATAMCLLALQKLKDVESFSTMFLNYDLLGRAWVPYAYLYPWAELVAGLLMLGGVLTFLAAPLALFIGAVGAASVAKAVYVEKRELKCACMGGDSEVPLGFVSLTENLMMAAMGLIMLGLFAL